MLSLETAIEKLKQLSPEQQKRAIEFIEKLEARSNRQQPNNKPKIDLNPERDFFELAGIWENNDISIESLCEEAWKRNNQ